MKRLLFMLVAVAMVACTGSSGDAKKESVEYKEKAATIASAVDVATVEASGFEAWYNSLSNIDIRNLNNAAKELEALGKEVSKWYDMLGDDAQTKASDAAKSWSEENVDKQKAINIFVWEVMQDKSGIHPIIAGEVTANKEEANPEEPACEEGCDKPTCEEGCDKPACEGQPCDKCKKEESEKNGCENQACTKGEEVKK